MRKQSELSTKQDSSNKISFILEMGNSAANKTMFSVSLYIHQNIQGTALNEKNGEFKINS